MIFMCFSSVPPSKCRDSVLETETFPFYVPPKLLFMNHFLSFGAKQNRCGLLSKQTRNEIFRKCESK